MINSQPSFPHWIPFDKLNFCLLTMSSEYFMRLPMFPSIWLSSPKRNIHSGPSTYEKLSNIRHNVYEGYEYKPIQVKSSKR